ncbi:MAG: hypothetical protein GF344_13245, partial [Chitinivibrionales bacterium]|nr:hypothetical protein [Chitinivibrionales bacterium]MBD3357697.1 hypothetical protein [Chitinivibrionales bacterium]
MVHCAEFTLWTVNRRAGKSMANRRETAIALILILMAAGSSLSESTSRRCWINSMIGTVKVRRGNSNKWIDARPNMPLRPKDAVRTFVESKAAIRTSEGTVIDVGENSTVQMSVFAQNEDGSRNTSVKIFNGSVMSDVKKLVTKRSKFEFETPTATAAIRGTRVGLDVTSDKTDIRVYEGRVFVKPSGGGKGAELGSNQMTSVARDQKEVKIRELMEKPSSGSSAADSATIDSATIDSGMIDSGM